MGVLIPPIIVVEGLDISIYPSADDAARSLEPWWVDRNEGTVYDAAGHRLQVFVSRERAPSALGLKGSLIEKVQIMEGDPPVNAEGELRSCLSAYLRKAGVKDEGWLANSPLPVLIEALQR